MEDGYERRERREGRKEEREVVIEFSKEATKAVERVQEGG